MEASKADALHSLLYGVGVRPCVGYKGQNPHRLDDWKLVEKYKCVRFVCMFLTFGFGKFSRCAIAATGVDLFLQLQFLKLDGIDQLGLHGRRSL